MKFRKLRTTLRKNKKFIEVSNNTIKKLSDELDKYRTKNSKILGSTDKANETSRKNVMKKITEDENTIEKIKSDIQAVKKTNQELSVNVADYLTQIEKIISDKQNVKISIENFTKNFYGMIDFDYFMHTDYAPYLDNGVIDVINQDRAKIV